MTFNCKLFSNKQTKTQQNQHSLFDATNNCDGPIHRINNIISYQEHGSRPERSL